MKRTVTLNSVDRFQYGKRSLIVIDAIEEEWKGEGGLGKILYPTQTDPSLPRFFITPQLPSCLLFRSVWLTERLEKATFLP